MHCQRFLAEQTSKMNKCELIETVSSTVQITSKTRTKVLQGQKVLQFPRICSTLA